MRDWLTAFVLSMQASIALAGELPRAITPDDFPVPGATSVLLGRDLFFDPILSGNRNIACSSCHVPSAGSADAVSLTLGEGAQGLATARISPDGHAARIARHTPALFNLGAHEFDVLMHDGRVASDPATRFGFALPEPAFLERPVTSALAAQALMPMIAPDEMAGRPGSNPVADAVAAGNITGLGGAWDLIARRVADTPEYRQRFQWLIGDNEPIHITHIAQALADFTTYEFRATNSPFDAFLRGDDSALSNDQMRGLSLFYGKAQCSTCHSGPFQTDHDFHAIAMPQFGPGKDHGPGTADHGRAAISGEPSDKYRFRTPSLRNVALTAPYGHTGAYATLGGIIRHHADPLTGLAEYLGAPAILPGSATYPEGAMQDFDEVLAIGMASEIALPPLSDREIEALVAFLGALTDPVSVTGRLGPPRTLPSGLPLDQGIVPPS